MLLKWGAGDEVALQNLIPLVHRELHDIARRCMAGERPGNSLQATAPFDEALMVGEGPGQDVIALDEALAKFDERKSRVVELRFLGGLSVEATASVLKVSPDTVMRDWRLAKAWLLREMRVGRT